MNLNETICRTVHRTVRQIFFPPPAKNAPELPGAHSHNDEKYREKAVKNLSLILPPGLTNN
ncbi:MAG: hypothetical protein Q4G31_01875 [bacterium]|nr:hypothetical protein [bacterium]